MRSRIDVAKIQAGVRFSADVYFDDGINMFLGANKPAKNYHVACIQRWKVPFLISEGQIITESSSSSVKMTDEQDFAELEDLEELEEL